MTAHAIHGWPKGRGGLATFVRENALSMAALLLFFVSIVGQALTGFQVANEDAREHGGAVLTFATYLTSGDFVEAVFENWESEFLQMGVFVVLTKFLRQKGSSESKALDGHEEVDEDPKKKKHDPEAPWPVRRGGIVLAIYQRSLFIALMLLFLGSFVLHAVGGVSKHNEEAIRHGRETISLLSYLGSSQFWFESFQNWQSEFLSVAALVLLSIVLRERGSPQSKPVAASHGQTGGG
jgi:hypothetical protein